jgi:hypothetical protein
VSLILEALKKLEREKQAPQRGVIVLGATSWSGAPGERRLGLFLLGLLIGATLLGLARWGQQPAPAGAPPSAAAALGLTPPRPLPQKTAPASPAGAAAPRLVPATLAAAVEPSRPAPAFMLQAISEREGRPVAIVNDRLLREGDSIDGARIVRIAKDEVELELQGRRVLLRF